MEALERGWKAHSNFEAMCKVSDKLKKQITTIKAHDEQRDYVQQLTNDIKEQARETAELRMECDALKRINREQQKQWKENSSPKNSRKMQELQQQKQDRVVELKATVAQLKEKKQRVDLQLKEKEEVFMKKYISVMAPVSTARTRRKHSPKGGTRDSDGEYLDKHLQTLQHGREVDEKNNAALLRDTTSKLRDNKAQVEALQSELQKKEEEIRSNAAYLRTVKAQHRKYLSTIPQQEQTEKAKPSKPKKEEPKAKSVEPPATAPARTRNLTVRSPRRAASRSPARSVTRATSTTELDGSPVGPRRPAARKGSPPRHVVRKPAGRAPQRSVRKGAHRVEDARELAERMAKAFVSQMVTDVMATLENNA